MHWWGWVGVGGAWAKTEWGAWAGPGPGLGGAWAETEWGWVGTAPCRMEHPPVRRSHGPCACP